METNRPFTPRSRDDALRRLRRLTAGTAVMAAGGLALAGALAAHTLPGSGGSAAVASTTTTASTASAASSTGTTSGADTTSGSTASGLQPAASAPVVSGGTKAVAVSGGSR